MIEEKKTWRDYYNKDIAKEYRHKHNSNYSKIQKEMEDCECKCTEGREYNCLMSKHKNCHCKCGGQNHGKWRSQVV